MHNSLTSLPDRPAAATHGTQLVITPAAVHHGRGGPGLTRAGSVLTLVASRVVLAVMQPVPAARHLTSDPADMSARSARPITEPVRATPPITQPQNRWGVCCFRPNLRMERLE
jgi:hypothetical protein